MKSEVFLMDCMEGMKQYPDKYFDLAVVDPPYGIGMDKQKETKRRTSKHGRSVGSNWRKQHLKKNWDKHPPSEDYFNQLFRVSKNQIIWGANYFVKHLRPAKGWIVWYKKQVSLSMSDCELAFSSYDTVARIFEGHRCLVWNESPIHPTQKPVALYDWIYAKYLPQGGKVLDTHLGSGSNRIAADKAGNIEFTAFEIDKDYFEAQEERFRLYKSQLKLAI